MAYESRAYDNERGEPVVVLVTTGTHDVSRLINLFAGGVNVVEQMEVGAQVRRQVKRHNGGRDALRLLRQHGGPDFTGADAQPPAEWIDPATGDRYDLAREYVDRDDDTWKLSGWLHWTDGHQVPVMSVLEVEHSGDYTDVPLPDVIETFGPLTAADELVEAVERP